MLDGTERDVLELLLGGQRTPTEVAQALSVSVQTASRTLKQLDGRGLAREVPRERRDGGGRGYKPYEARAFARVFAGYDGALVDRTLTVTEDKRAVLSVWQIPQAEFHPVVLSYLFAPPDEPRYDAVEALAVYGSVARGEAKPDSDVDVLVVCEESVDTDEIYSTTFRRGGGVGAFRDERVVSETWYTVGEFEDAVAAGSQFLDDALAEAVVLYDPDDVIRDVRHGPETGGRVSGTG